MLEVTQAEAARLPGIKVSKQRINALVKQGRIPAGKDRKVRVADVYRAFARDTDPAWDGQKADQFADARKEIAADHFPDAGKMVDDDSSSFRDARTRQALIAAERQQFELDRQRGLYLPKADVERAMQAAGMKIKQALDTLPQFADELFAAAQGGGAADLKKLLKEKTRRFQQSLADAVRLAATQEDDAAGA